MKKTMKRSLALGALMAFVITGSAMAGSIGTTTINGEVVKVNPTGNFTVGADGDMVEIKGRGHGVSITANGEKATILGTEIQIVSDNNRGLQIANGAEIYIGNKNTEKVSITGKDMGIFVYLPNSKGVVEAKEISVNSHGTFGVHVQNASETITAPKNASSLNMVAEKITITNTSKDGLGLSAYSNGQLNVSGDLVVNADRAIETRGNATINVNVDGKHSTVLNGDIVFGTPNTPENAQNSGKIINAYVNINLNGKDSSWTGKAFQEYKVDGEYVNNVEFNTPPYFGNVEGFKLNISNGASWNMTGDSFVNDLSLAKDGAVNIKDGVGKFNAAVVEMNGGVVNMEGSNTVVNVGELNGDGATVSTSSLDNKVNITTNKNKNVTVNGNGAIADQIAADNKKAEDLANVVVSGDKTVANKVTTDEGVIGGRFEADVVVGQDGTVTLDNVSQGKNSTNVAISEMGSIALMAWRQENNDMNKRLGELRNSNGEHGIWTRMTRGESEFKSVKNQYNAYQIGYDEKLSTDKSWTVGAALTYTDAQSSFAGGSGENTHKGFAVYGSKLNEDGSFIDLIAKYARLEHEFDAVGGIGKGEYDTNGYSVSAEYGKRFDKGNGFWVEPQVELTYGKVGSVNYATKEAVAYQDGMESLVGRVGFSLGKDIKDGNVYVRASYLYDFDGETEVTMMSKDGKASDTYEQDLGGGWFEVGVGTNINLSDATYVYFDVEKTYGGDVATPWQWNAGVRYSF